MTMPMHHRQYQYFRTYPGIPPQGEPGTYLGWDAEHNPYILFWQEWAGDDKACWFALGLGPGEFSAQRPALYRLDETRAGFIVEWAFSPVTSEVISPEQVWLKEQAEKQKLKMMEDMKNMYTSVFQKDQWAQSDIMRGLLDQTTSNKLSPVRSKDFFKNIWGKDGI